MKIILVGQAGSGKDTVAEIVHRFYGLTFGGCTNVITEEVIFPALKDKYSYKTAGDCYLDRHDKRQEWANIIANYNRNDPIRLLTLVLSKYDVYVGLRCRGELTTLKERCRAVKVIMIKSEQSWHEENECRTPSGHRDVGTILDGDADHIILNDGTIDELTDKVFELMDGLNIKCIDGAV